MDIWGRPDRPLVGADSNPGQVSLRPGGVGRNIAHDLSLLGLKVSLIAALGSDIYAGAIKESCRALGIDLSYAPVSPDMSSGCYLYISDEKGEMALAVSDMEICSLMDPALVLGLLPKIRTRSMVLDANLPEDTLIALAEHSPWPVYADPVSTAKGEKLRPILHRLRAIKPNALEAKSLTGEDDPQKAAAELVRMGVSRVFISLGAEGMVAADEKGVLRLPPVPTQVVNSTGAGDAATAAIVAGDLWGMDLAETACLAQQAGAITCRSMGANAPELRQLARSGGAERG